MSLHFLGLPNGASRYYGIQARQDALMMAATTLRSETLRELVLASMYVRHAQIGPRPTVQQSMRAGEVSGVPVLCFTVDVEKANQARARARACPRGIELAAVHQCLPRPARRRLE